jgi:hypothetical protein
MKIFLLWLLFILANIAGITSFAMVVRGFSRKDGELLLIGGAVGLLSLYLGTVFAKILF